MSTIQTPKAQRKFSAQRDEFGVPHVRADNRNDALYALGYLHALDRGTQLLFARSVASGRSAEQIADRAELRETDRFFRRVGLHLHLQREVDCWPESIRQQVDAYCDGLNDGIVGTGRSLPMWATGFYPERWQPSSVLLVGQLLSFGGLAVGQMQNERLLLELIHAGIDESALREMFASRLDQVDFDLLRRVNMSNQLSQDALDVLTDLPRLAGSNAWAVRGERTESGHPLLASDPHLEINRLPGIWYEAVLNWGEAGNEYVMGATLPGCPLFAVARTPRLAWGVTYMKGDTIDFFVEDCRPGGETGWQYRRGDSWLDFRRRDEKLGGKGGRSESLQFYFNEQGTLESDPVEPGLYLSMAWTGSAPGGAAKAISTWLDVVASPGVEVAMDVVRECPQPTLCFVLADRDNHIGLQGTGRFPKRPDPHAGLTPLPAWDEKHHWQGWLSNKWLPRVLDPPEGFLSTANEGWNPADGPLLVTQIPPSYRKQRIDERLSELHPAKLTDMQDLQYDTLSVHARDLLPRLLKHLPQGEHRDRLANWDFRYDIDSREAVLFHRLYIQLIIEVFGHEALIGWRRIVYLCTRAGYSGMILNAADRVLMGNDSSWWRGRDPGDLVRSALEKIVDKPEKTWGEFNFFHFTDRFFGRRRAGRLLGFDSARQPMPGCAATPFQGHVFQTATHEQTFAPSYHFVADLGSDVAWTNLPGGPHESRFSRYYKSDVRRWQTGEYKPLRKSAESSDDVAAD